MNTNENSNSQWSDSNWKSIYKIAGAAALIIGVVFRRNISAEIVLFSTQKNPDTIFDWFDLLNSNRLLGLAYLNIFDIVNYMGVVLIFIALYISMRHINKSLTTIAAVFGSIGITIYFSSNTALSMLTLSDQYAAATMESQKTMLTAAGQAVMALNRFSNPGGHPGSGGYLSLFFIALAGLLYSIVMLRSVIFTGWTAYIGILANTLDLIYCLSYLFVSGTLARVLAVLFIPIAGLLFMIWHIMIGLKFVSNSQA